MDEDAHVTTAVYCFRFSLLGVLDVLATLARNTSSRVTARCPRNKPPACSLTDPSHRRAICLI